MSLPAKPRRRPRIGADSVHSWARNITFHNAHAKSIIMMMCHYVNDQGVANMGLETLAQDSDLSVNTVRDRLRWLDEIGAITRLPRWYDEHGRLNYEGRGRRTSDDIRFMLDVPEEDIEWNAWGRADAERDGPDEPSYEVSAPQPDPTHGVGLNPEPETVVPPLALQRPSTCAEGIDSLNCELKKDSPQSPPILEASEQESGLSKEASEAEAQCTAALQKFKATYPIPTNRPDRLEAVWRTMTGEQWHLCQRGAEGARRHREANAKRPPPLVDPAKYAATPSLWAEYVRYALPEPPKVTDLDRDSEEWLALRLMRVIAGLNTGQPRKVGPIPAGSDNLADLARSVGFPDTHNRFGWQLVERDSKHFTAWAERIREWTGQWPEVERILLDREGNPAATPEDAADSCLEICGKKILGKRRTIGLLVPSLWPPAKSPGDRTTSQQSPASPDETEYYPDLAREMGG